MQDKVSGEKSVVLNSVIEIEYLNIFCAKWSCSILEKLKFNKFVPKLHYVKIMFKTPKFGRITRDRAAKIVDQLSAIGGTMGLLTGFSIISGVEILYYTAKIILTFLKKFKNVN